jgi:hypothetical protein
VGRKAKSKDEEPRLLKWVGGVTAVLSLAFAIQQAIQIVSDSRERQRQIVELTSVATAQRNSGDYRAAWATLEKAIETAEPSGQLAKLTGQLSEQRRQLRETQEDLAMVWLENLRPKNESESFSDLIVPLDPVINRGITSSTGPRQADLLAHAGWATFLKWRDARGDLDPDRQYVQALQVDPKNPYANAYRGHWLLWTKRGKALSEARALFGAALASGRVKEHVRRMQLSAFRNLGSDGEADFIAAINEMRMKGEAIDVQARADYYAYHSFACGLTDDRKRLERLMAMVTPADNLATFQALFFGANTPRPDEQPRPGADACLAVLLEVAGHADQALPVWTALAERLPASSGNYLGDRARQAVMRLRRQVSR